MRGESGCWVGKLDGARSGAFAGAGLRAPARLIGVRADFIGRGHEFIQPGARHDHRIAPAVRVLRDAEETSARILAELNDEALALDIYFFAGDDGIHVGPGDKQVWLLKGK